MNQFSQTPSSLFCHPNSIESHPGRLPRFIFTTNSTHSPDLPAFYQAMQSGRVLPGDLSHYPSMFEEVVNFIRVVRARPCGIRTYLEAKNVQEQIFYEFPSVVPSMSYFQFRSVLLETVELACSECGQTFYCYLYLKGGNMPVVRRRRGDQPPHVAQGSDSDDAGSTEISYDLGKDEQGFRVNGREMARGLIRRARKCLRRGTRWLELKMRKANRR